ncbi:MAG: hypothetical protein LC660_11515, partial [Desulfobacteraceae bacterium]|nr:hypothetical protein [Desulfobacteraceae bacterium]
QSPEHSAGLFLAISVMPFFLAGFGLKLCGVIRRGLVNGTSCQPQSASPARKTIINRKVIGMIQVLVSCYLFFCGCIHTAWIYTAT